VGQEEDIQWIKRALQKTLGRSGFNIINDTEIHNGEWVRITMIESTVFQILSTEENGNELPEALTFHYGVDIYGAFDSIQLVSGAIIAYKG